LFFRPLADVAATLQGQVTRTGGKTVLKFTKPFDATFTGKGEQNFIAARGKAGPLSVHDAREAFTAILDGSGAATAAGPTSPDSSKGSDATSGTGSGSSGEQTLLCMTTLQIAVIQQGK
jgi:hypothetical protein